MSSRTASQVWSKVLEAGTYCIVTAEMHTDNVAYFKKKSNYPDFIHILITRRPSNPGNKSPMLHIFH